MAAACPDRRMKVVFLSLGRNALTVDSCLPHSALLYPYCGPRAVFYCPAVTARATVTNFVSCFKRHVNPTHCWCRVFSASPASIELFPIRSKDTDKVWLFRFKSFFFPERLSAITVRSPFPIRQLQQNSTAGFDTYLAGSPFEYLQGRRFWRRVATTFSPIIQLCSEKRSWVWPQPLLPNVLEFTIHSDLIISFKSV